MVTSTPDFLLRSPALRQTVSLRAGAEKERIRRSLYGKHRNFASAFRRYIPPADVDNYEKEIREAAAPADNPEPGTADLPAGLGRAAAHPAAASPSPRQTESVAEPVGS